MTRKAISDHRTPSSSCDVCGRTLLRGEQADVFLAGGTRRMVCELCTARAAHEGWIREGLDDTPSVAPPRARAPRRSLLRRLRARTSRPSCRAGRRPAADRRAEPEPLRRAATDRRRRRRPGASEPAREPPREPRHVHAVPDQRRAEASRARSSSSTAAEHPRTVAGVARSLGAPARRRAPVGRPRAAIVSIVVGWELSLVPLRGRPRPTRRPACASPRQGDRAGRARRRPTRRPTRPPTTRAR